MLFPLKLVVSSGENLYVLILCPSYLFKPSNGANPQKSFFIFFHPANIVVGQTLIFCQMLELNFIWDISWGEVWQDKIKSGERAKCKTVLGLSFE